MRLFRQNRDNWKNNKMLRIIEMQAWLKITFGAVFSILMMTNARAQTPANPMVTAVYTYADVADLAITSDVVAHVRVKKAKRLSKELSQGVVAGRQRYVVTADVVSLIRGTGGIDPRISYLIDLPTDSRGRTESMGKREYIIFAMPTRPGEVRLVAPDAQIPSSPEAGAMVRRILTEALKPAAPPRILGIGSAFHADGNLPGEGETQLFLNGEGDRSVSISIVQSPTAPVVWQVAVNDVVDEGSGPPRRNSLLWYRLACALPAALPDDILVGQAPDATDAIKRDYAIVIQGLGPCKRARRTAMP
jgi:hypothetical protein